MISNPAHVRRKSDTTLPPAKAHPVLKHAKKLTAGAIALILFKEIILIHPADMIAELGTAVVIDILKPVFALAGDKHKGAAAP